MLPCLLPVIDEFVIDVGPCTSCTKRFRESLPNRVTSSRVRLGTSKTHIPMLAGLATLSSLKVMSPAEPISTPYTTVFWISPPESSTPVPVTVNGPDPALLSRMPIPAPFVETDSNVTPPDPIVVPSISTGVPVVVVITDGTPVTSTVPPPVAMKASLALVRRSNCPEKKSWLPVFPSRKTPGPPSAVREAPMSRVEFAFPVA